MNPQVTEKIYHVYAKNNCIYHSLSEEEFKEVWDMLNKFVSISGRLDKNDLSYEELVLSKETALNSSHWQDIDNTVWYECNYNQLWLKDSQ